MGRIPFYLILLQSFPETVLLIWSGLILIGIKPGVKCILSIAFIESMAFYLIAALPLPPGINVFIQLPILVVLVAYFCKINLIYATLASFIGLVIISLAETGFNFITSVVSGITIHQALAHPLWRLLYPLPEFAFLAASIFVLNHYKLALFNIKELNALERLKNNEKE